MYPPFIIPDAFPSPSPCPLPWDASPGISSKERHDAGQNLPNWVEEPAEFLQIIDRMNVNVYDIRFKSFKKLVDVAKLRRRITWFNQTQGLESFYNSFLRNIPFFGSLMGPCFRG